MTSVAEDSVASAAEWCELIRCVWARGGANTLELAQVMYAARKQLPHGKWTAIWKSDRMPFSKRKGDMLAAIGSGLRWANEQTFAHLPVGWSVLYHLAKLDRRTLERLIQEGVVHPALKLWEAKKLAAQFLGKTIEVNSPKARVGERLRRFAGFVRVTLPDWTHEERTLATRALTRIIEQIGVADRTFDRNGVSHPFLTRGRLLTDQPNRL